MNMKQRYIAILVSIPLIIAILYSTLISETLERGRRIRNFESDAIRIRNRDAEWIALSEKLSRLEKILQAGDHSSSDSFFSDMSVYCAEQGITLKNYSIVNSVKQQPYHCITRLVTFEAPFLSLLFLVDHIEKKRSDRIRALSFESIRKREGIGLRLNLYIQFVIE